MMAITTISSTSVKPGRPALFENFRIAAIVWLTTQLILWIFYRVKTHRSKFFGSILI
jgi:hypothetical protein